VLVNHSIEVNHRINFDNCVIGYVEHVVKQVIKNKLYASDLHRINGFMLQGMFRLSNEQAKQKIGGTFLLHMREHAHYTNEEIFRQLQKNNFN
jgi:hypothetical protein